MTSLQHCLTLTCVINQVLKNKELLDTARDCFRFVVKFFEPINISATHIYHSALELSPASSIIRRLYYHQQDSDFPKVVAGTQDLWDESIHHSSIPSCTYNWSPCSQFVAVAVEGVVKILDALTLEPLSILQPTEPISQLMGKPTYSPNGHYLACFSRTALIIWDIQTGGVAKEIGSYGVTGSISLVWSWDGRTIGFIEHITASSLITSVIHMCYVASGTIWSLDVHQPSKGLHLWACNESFRVMTLRGVGSSSTVEISEVESALTKIESFNIGKLGSFWEFEPFSPTTYHLSVRNETGIVILDLWSLTCLLSLDDPFYFYDFSPDGSFYTITQPSGTHIYRYTSGSYTLWREFSAQYWTPSRRSPLQFSPNSLSILGHFKAALQVQNLDGLPITTSPNSCTPLAVLSCCGTYIATSYEGNSTVTITNIHSKTHPQFIDAGMAIRVLALTGNVLLVVGFDELVAWKLTKNGTVDGVFANRRAGCGDSIWTISASLPFFSVEDQTVIVRNGGVTYTYNTETGEIIEPAQASPNPHSYLYYYSMEMQCCQHYLHYRNLDTQPTLPEDNWQVSSTTLQEGWVKDAEGKHRLWIPAQWRANTKAGWFYNITTLRINHPSGAVIIMF